MSRNSDPVTIVEYERITRGDSKLTTDQFDLLREFIVSNRESKASPTELMGISPMKCGGEQIYAKNYVGVISLKDGTQIEILPKVHGRIRSGDGYGADDESGDVPGKGEIEDSRRIFLRMLGTASDLKGKSLQSAELDTARMPLFEVFVRMFLDEVFEIIKRGLKGGYTLVSRNEPFMKGKLCVAQNIRENFAHAERFYVQYDEFNPDQPENRLIRATLEYLKNRSWNMRNRQDIRVLLSELDEIIPSSDVEGDLRKAAVLERNNAYYQTALSWCGVFLRDKTFTSFAGKNYATAILFPMDALYESYVAKMLRKSLPDDYRVHPQERKYYLFEGSEKFRLIPDVVISHGDETLILDTKWKILNSDSSKNYGISQGDMYQMYAYCREYEAHGKNVRGVITLYPDIAGRPKTEPVFSMKKSVGKDGDGKKAVRIMFLNLMDEDFKEITEKIKNLV